MRALGRIVAAMIGFIAAVLAAAGFLLAAKVGLEPPAAEQQAWFWGRFLIYGGMAASMLGAAAFLPFVLWVLLTEILSIRSFIAHVGLGGLMGLVGSLGLDRMQERLAEHDMTFAADATLLVAAGFVAGFVYWLVAGRMAGLRSQARPPAET